MRPIVRGSIPKDQNNIEIVFTDYARSRRYLIDRIGEYCSYCERKIEASLAVEHVRPKVSNPDLKYAWNNFLLACTNCNSTKGSKNVVLVDYYWPDSDNTFGIFSYDNSGIVRIRPQITDLSLRAKAQNTLDLVGLQKHPPSVGSADWEKASDRRYEQRIQAWIESNDYSQLYIESSIEIRHIMLDLIITIVIYQGFWSIWMLAFNGFPEVQLQLVNAIAGTNRACFPNLS